MRSLRFLMSRRVFLLSSVFLCLAASQVALFAANPGSTPRLNLITPRGVQRGTEVVLRFSGQRLDQAEEVFLYDKGVEVLELRPVDASKLDVRIKVAEDCRLGEHVAQVRTSRGISDYRSFFVGPFSEVVEVEPNNQAESAQAISQNITINGTITTEDVDIFKMELKQGQRLSVEIEAMRLGQWFDPFIAVLNDEKFEIAVSDDSNLNRQDGIVSIKVPEDGTYFVVVREASYGGNENSRYRLHVGDFPRPTVVYPPGAKPGSELELRFVGDPFGPFDVKTTVEMQSEIRIGLPFEAEGHVTPSPVAMMRSQLENVLESEPNNKWSEASEPSSLPKAFNGIIQEPGDEDHFAFEAKKGEVFDVECYSRRLKSGLDPVINILNHKGRNLVGDDDARRPDCYLRFTAPETGYYILRVRDHLKRGQPEFVYRVEVNQIKPKISITIPRVDRYSQLRQQICVPQGNRFATLINATKVNFGGELEILAENLPPGIKMIAPKMVANLNSVPVLFEAEHEAELSGSLAELTAKPTDEKQTVIGAFRLLADFSLGQPNNASYHRCVVEKLACAITRKVPFSIEIQQPVVPLVRNGSMNLKILVSRAEGFDQPINVQFPFRPPGVGTIPQIQIKKGETSALYPINANGNAQMGKWSVYAMAQANVDGPVWVSSQLAELEIAQPFVTMDVSRTVCNQGESSSVHCKLNQQVPFEGEGTAELLGIPPHIEIPKLRFTSETKALDFEVLTTDKSPVGKHKGLFCRIAVPMNGDVIISTAGRSELQINKPVTAKKTVASPKPAAPAAKSKSRLQQLREAAREKRAERSGG